MSQSLAVEDFLKAPGVLFDVRSPGEFSHARIPAAVNLPLFNNQERAEVGTLYKRRGKGEAIELGLKFVGPKLADFVSEAKKFSTQNLAKVHCWRGGMRSSSMAWLLATAGMQTATLKGGYKAFRKWVLQQFSLPRQFIVLGGMTGSGKTAILQSLIGMGEQVIDLEEIANHRGSSYGKLNLSSQPSNEQFENEIAVQLFHFRSDRPVWIEDESRMVGTCLLPKPLFEKMRQAPLLFIERPFQERLDLLLQEYGHSDPQQLIAATLRIAKRLGSELTHEIIKAIQINNLSEAIQKVIKYYDSTYLYGISQRNQPIEKIYAENLSSHQWAQKILEVK